MNFTDVKYPQKENTAIYKNCDGGATDNDEGQWTINEVCLS